MIKYGDVVTINKDSLEKEIKDLETEERKKEIEENLKQSQEDAKTRAQNRIVSESQLRRRFTI